MKITGEDLFKIWMAWPETEDLFVIQYETLWGEERYLNVLDMTPCAHDDKAYEIICHTNKFRKARRFVPKTKEFEIDEPGRFIMETW